MKFKALRALSLTECKVAEMSEAELTPGKILIRVQYSGINYKDALAGTGRGKILKKFPLNLGIDAAGTVVKSEDPTFKKGDEVLVTGCNTGEVYDGGFSEMLFSHPESVIKKPAGLSLKETMILGTAGFTAALALIRMEQNGQTPDMGPVVITGASGGVGSFAVQLFSRAGYSVTAVSGKPELKTWLASLGADHVILPSEIPASQFPLESVRYGGAVDNVGGNILSSLVAQTQIYGNIATVGLAESALLNTTVMPFILRGVSLIGISSNNCPRKLREQIWQKLSTEWKPKHLQDLVFKEIGLSEIPKAFQEMLDRQTHGRILLNLAGNSR